MKRPPLLNTTLSFNTICLKENVSWADSEVYVNWLYLVTNLYVFIFIFNVSFQDLVVFGVEVLDTIC